MRGCGGRLQHHARSHLSQRIRHYHDSAQHHQAIIQEILGQGRLRSRYSVSRSAPHRGNALACLWGQRKGRKRDARTRGRVDHLTNLCTRNPTDRRAQLERAVDRATMIGLEPTGAGRLRDGAKFWLVPSQTESGKLYVVTLRGNQLACNCPACVVCTHIASVVMELVGRAARRAEWAAEVEDTLTAERDVASFVEAAVSASAPRHRSRTGLMDDVAPLLHFPAVAVLVARSDVPPRTPLDTTQAGLPVESRPGLWSLLGDSSCYHETTRDAGDSVSGVSAPILTATSPSKDGAPPATPPAPSRPRSGAPATSPPTATRATTRLRPCSRGANTASPP